jgi:SnoaL-like domain
MTRMAHAEDFEAISMLLASYCTRMDRVDAEGWADLFTEDGRFFALGRSFDGRARLERLAREADRGVHLVGPPVIDVDGERATAQQNFVFVLQVDHGMRIGWYDDELVRTSDGWRFRSRRCTFVSATGPSERP